MGMTASTATAARQFDLRELRRAYEAVREALLAWQRPEGCWEGELSSSALATATAVSAFAAVSRDGFEGFIGPGVAWLVAHQNADGGWGDTPESPSNISTTMLVEAALDLSGVTGPDVEAARRRAEPYLCSGAGPWPEDRVRALQTVYGGDRTFAAPILANCALAPAPDEARVRWEDVPALPFELGCLPRPAFRWLKLDVVSYALPALIAIGQLRHTKQPSRNPVLRALRTAAVMPTLRRLEAIQPESGGFLEATPLTSFVIMSLAGAGRSDHPVARRGLEFLTRSVRPDGSWPIDTNLSHWLTSLAVAALNAGGATPADGAARTRRWLLACQHRQRHPYTGSAPGGWAWTNLSGGVPDADDTSAALLALKELGGEATDAARQGVQWLLDLQNRDGGWPTFCRGWGRLPFDSSAPDLTAHALRAIAAWQGVAPASKEKRAIERGLDYLRRAQRADGAWVPLWFGNQHAPRHGNPVYGTARVLAAYRDLSLATREEPRRGAGWLVQVQNPDGGWGGAAGVPSSIEETALAVDALAGWADDADSRAACHHGCAHLVAQVREGELSHPAPIGLYFAHLWYAERLYPVIWTVSALGRVLATAQIAGLPAGASGRPSSVASAAWAQP
jgi:squalene-hopene/tetraprenyl-beta-curcumene cyclase